VLSINARAYSLYENIGFRVEGRRRDAYRDGEGWCDAIIMAMLEEEYRALRAA
jgi:RimJ/RimL family protein N-acetyltransferase